MHSRRKFALYLCLVVVGAIFGTGSLYRWYTVSEFVKNEKPALQVRIAKAWNDYTEQITSPNRSFKPDSACLLSGQWDDLTLIHEYLERAKLLGAPFTQEELPATLDLQKFNKLLQDKGQLYLEGLKIGQSRGDWCPEIERFSDTSYVRQRSEFIRSYLKKVQSGKP